MITQQQITSASTAAQQLVTASQQFLELVSQISTLSANNWVISTTANGLTFSATILPADQATIIAQYTTLKNNLATIYAQLP